MAGQTKGSKTGMGSLANTGQVESSGMASLADMRVLGLASLAVTGGAAVDVAAGEVCAAQTHNMVIAITESTANGGRTSGNTRKHSDHLTLDHWAWKS